MVNLADLPSAGALSGSETLPMQQGSGAVKVTANQLLSRAAGQALPFEIGGQRIATVTETGVGIGTTSPDSPLTISGSSDIHARIGGLSPGVTTTIRVQSRNAAGTASYYGDIRVRPDVQSLVLCSPGTNVGNIAETLYLRGGTALVGKNTANVSLEGCELRPSRAAFTANAADCLWLNRLSSNGQLVACLRDSDTVGSISVTTSSTSFNTTSDYRLPWKAGHTALTGSGDFIDALNPRFFPVVGHAGFIAHEFAVASPSSVTGEKDAVDEDGNPVYQQMDASSPDVMANIIAELQSLRRRVAALEAAT